MQFSAIVNRFILKAQLNSAFTNDLKRKDFFEKMFIVADLVSLTFLLLYYSLKNRQVLPKGCQARTHQARTQAEARTPGLQHHLGIDTRNPDFS